MRLVSQMFAACAGTYANVAESSGLFMGSGQGRVGFRVKGQGLYKVRSVVRVEVDYGVTLMIYINLIWLKQEECRRGSG